MKFGPVPLAEAGGGAIPAHSPSAGGRRLKKGRVLSAADPAALAKAGVASVTIARLDPDDRPEDAAAEAVAPALAGAAPGERSLALSAPFIGRANLFAEVHGALRLYAEGHPRGQCRA